MTNKDININELTRGEWRNLGFYYERDDNQKIWLFQGSRDGMGQSPIFCLFFF